MNKLFKTGRRTSALLKKLTLSVLLCTVTAAPAVASATDADGALQTIYHVYMDEEHAGKVSDSKLVENLIGKKIDEASKEYGNLSLTTDKEITFVSEKVFNPSYNNEKVIEELTEEISVKANATELKVAGTTVGHFRDEQTAKKALESYMANYVEENSLEELLENDLFSVDRNREEAAEKSRSELELGDKETTAVELSEEISLTEAKVAPDDIMKAEEGADILEKGTLEEKVHVVKEGDVLGKIASKYDLSTDKLLEINPDLKEGGLLEIDAELQVMEYKPLVDVLVTEEELVEESVDFQTEIIEDDDMLKGEQKVKQEGKKGKKEVLYSIQKMNGKEKDRKALEQDITKEPVKEIIIKGTKVISSKGTGEMAWPAVGGYISSHPGERWGKQHKGIDIAGPTNKNILAADNGVVESAGFNSGGYGNLVVINHNNGMVTKYAHLDSIDVKAGQVVEKGSKIGVMGTTGDSTGIHLHFEVYKNGALQNPNDYVKK